MYAIYQVVALNYMFLSVCVAQEIPLGVVVATSCTKKIMAKANISTIILSHMALTTVYICNCAHI